MNWMKRRCAAVLVLLVASVGGCSIHLERGIQPDPTGTIFMHPIQELPTMLPSGDAWMTLPPPVQDEHRTSTLSITWHNQPYPGWYDVISLRNDGRLRHWRVVESSSSVQEIYPAGQLTQQEVIEVQRLLEKLTTAMVVPHDTEATVVILSFVWEGELQHITVDQFHCTSEMVRLFEIIDGVFERHPDISRSSLNPCRAATAEDPFTTTTISPTTYFTFSNLPDAMRRFHQGFPLITVIWFQQPFEDSYHVLSISYGRSMIYIYHLSDAQSYYQVRKGQVNDSQMQTLQHVLSRMNTEENSRNIATQTMISVGYSWKGDYRLRLFGETACSDELKGLFAIAIESLDMSGLDLDSNAWPCQE